MLSCRVRKIQRLHKIHDFEGFGEDRNEGDQFATQRVKVDVLAFQDDRSSPFDPCINFGFFKKIQESRLIAAK